MGDLVKRLKYEAARHKRPLQDLRKTVCWEAADRIRELEAVVTEQRMEIQQLDAELDNSFMEECRHE